MKYFVDIVHYSNPPHAGFFYTQFWLTLIQYEKKLNTKLSDLKKSKINLNQAFIIHTKHLFILNMLIYR